MHTHYKGTGKVHSFRGMLPTGEQNEISIEGSVGAIAWRITKFQTMGTTPGANSPEHVSKIYREQQTSIDGTVDFRQDELLAVSLWHKSSNLQYPTTDDIIFDNALFVRNIYVSQIDIASGVLGDCSYYIELEEVTVSAAGKAQLALAAARRTGDR
jgi:hypothetical protein